MSKLMCLVMESDPYKGAESMTCTRNSRIVLLSIYGSLLHEDGTPYEGADFLLKHLIDSYFDVYFVAFSIKIDVMQKQLQQSALANPICKIIYGRTIATLERAIKKSFVLSNTIIYAGATQAELLMVRKLGMSFCYCSYATDDKDIVKLNFLKSNENIAASAKKILTVCQIRYDNPRKVLNFNADLRGFCSPVLIPRDINGIQVYKPLAEEVIDKTSNVRVLHVRDFRTLIQAINKIKYIHGSGRSSTRGSCNVYFRGQAELYNGNMCPSAYRTIGKSFEKKRMIDKELHHKLCKFRRNAGDTIKALRLKVLEGLFQQYEEKTRWLDAVDNVWVALWFSCQRRWERNGFVQYVTRSPSLENPEFQYAYIVVLVADKKCEILDLRTQTPSQFLRPHVQHGVLLRKRGKDKLPCVDMSGLVHGIIRIDLSDALTWLGNSPSLSATMMFPNPAFDSGFSALIDDCKRMSDGRWSDLEVPYFK